MKKYFSFLVFIFILIWCNNTWIKWDKQEFINNDIENNVVEKIVNKNIYTSFYPIYFLTKSFLWDNVNIINLVPAWWDPHDYEPTLRQMWDLQKSDLIILNWLWIEHYEEKLIENIWDEKIILLSEKLSNLIDLSENNEDEDHEDEDHKEENSHEHWNIDPHTWLSPKIYLEMANILALELEKRWYTNLDKTIIKNLEQLNNEYSEVLSNCSKYEIITSHEAFWYLARDYNFSQHAIMWISPEEEPSAKDISWVIDLIRREKVKYIFSEEFVSSKFSDTIKKETWVEVLNLHPLETLSNEQEFIWDNYISIMEKNLEQLKIWLECK